MYQMSKILNKIIKRDILCDYIYSNNNISVNIKCPNKENCYLSNNYRLLRDNKGNLYIFKNKNILRSFINDNIYNNPCYACYYIKKYNNIKRIECLSIFY